MNADLLMTLDVPEKQIVIFYPGDPVPWQARLLLQPLGEARWIWATPDLEVQVHDLTGERIKALVRSSPYPQDVRPLYAFDPLTPEQLAHIRDESRRLAAVLGVTPVDASGQFKDAVWVFADPAYEQFGKDVDAEFLAADTTAIRGSSGLVQVGSGTGVNFTFIERLLPSDREEWLDEKRTGAGRDPRLNAVTRLPTGARRVLFRDALLTMKAVDQAGWPFRGPAAVKEVMEGIVASGMEPPAFHAHWVRASGVSPHSGVAVEHGVLMTVIWMAATVDQLDLLNVASLEMAARRLLMLERAVRRNARQPDFDGLSAFLANALDDSGGVTTADFDRYIAELQKNDAQVMKQSRLLREEVDSAAKKKASAKHGAGGDSK